MNKSALTLNSVGKTYRLYASGGARLSELLFGQARHDAFVALHDISLELKHGEVLGIIGRNGAGKSTLLKILAGTLIPTCGRVSVHGRVAALLELGSGFHPDLSGRDNVFLYGSVLGLSHAEIQSRFNEIVSFAGIEAFIDHPVKTYSSGMQVRLAFSVATSVDPEILIIDEALSVGDGAFARKSFDRIIQFRDSGKTIVFCSHSMYQVEAICDRVIWIDHGRLVLAGTPKEVCAAYNEHLAGAHDETSILTPEATSHVNATVSPRILGVTLGDGHTSGRSLAMQCGVSDLSVVVDFSVVEGLAPPCLIVALVGSNGEAVCSALSNQDDFNFIPSAESSKAQVRLVFPALPLLRGRYTVDVYLMCERGIHCYEQVLKAGEVVMDHDGLEQGVVRLPHYWSASEAN